MCLAIPGRITAIRGADAADRRAEVDFEGSVKSASLLYVPEAHPGDYVIVQAGFAVRIIPEADALAALEMARQPLLPRTASTRRASSPLLSGAGP
ncbi:MAG: HypC/HybG/HupF family hydrogenase formation chaperone [Thermoplasmata archaeon]|nr:HypC/HybG/HupF family hydrogenase formation chaperone [Thermoplasmata archaeon]